MKDIIPFRLSLDPEVEEAIENVFKSNWFLAGQISTTPAILRTMESMWIIKIGHLYPQPVVMVGAVGIDVYKEGRANVNNWYEGLLLIPSDNRFIGQNPTKSIPMHYPCPVTEQLRKFNLISHHRRQLHSPSEWHYEVYIQTMFTRAHFVDFHHPLNHATSIIAFRQAIIDTLDDMSKRSKDQAIQKYIKSQRRTNFNSID